MKIKYPKEQVLCFIANMVGAETRLLKLQYQFWGKNYYLLGKYLPKELAKSCLET